MQNLTQTSSLLPSPQSNYMATSDPVDVTTWVTFPVTISQTAISSRSTLQPSLPASDTITTTLFDPVPSLPIIAAAPRPNSCTAYKYAVTALCCVIGITVVLSAVMFFCYVKPKRWKKNKTEGKIPEAMTAVAVHSGKNGGEEGEEELKELKKERDEWRGRYELLRTLPR